MRVLTVHPHLSPTELEAAYKHEKHPRVRENILTVLLVQEGRTALDVAGLLHRSEATVRRRVHLYNAPADSRPCNCAAPVESPP